MKYYACQVVAAVFKGYSAQAIVATAIVIGKREVCFPYLSKFALRSYLTLPLQEGIQYNYFWPEDKLM